MDDARLAALVVLINERADELERVLREFRTDAHRLLEGEKRVEEQRRIRRRSGPHG